MAAAAIAPSQSQELFISRASIQLQLTPSAHQVHNRCQNQIYEWRTQVTTPSPVSNDLANESAVKCIKTAATSSSAATPKYYTPPRIQGNEAKRRNLPQTLTNFFEVERHESAWNRVTKRAPNPPQQQQEQPQQKQDKSSKRK
ncbi:uncharacterized protein [Drosophila tropicalis]|uniref:uncharacterized protein n=1 Tax=Drosophila tropicalis TaxID=46794 RepID=UPI0035ABB10A